MFPIPLIICSINSKSQSFAAYKFQERISASCRHSTTALIDLPPRTSLWKHTRNVVPQVGDLGSASLPPNRFLLSTRCFHAFIDLQAGAVRHVLPPVTRSNRSRGRIPWWAFAPRVPNWPSLEAHFGHDEMTGSSRSPQSAGPRCRLMDRLLPKGSGRLRCRPPANKCNRRHSLREIKKTRTHAVVCGRPRGITQTKISIHTHAWDICVTRNTLDPECVSHLKC